MVKRRGALVISLDFELYWGVRDKFPLAQYRDNLLGVRQAIPGMLQLFETYGVHATWATVGFLFFRSQAELLQHLPWHTPTYENEHLSPYSALNTIGWDEAEDPYHFAPSLIQMIADTPHQQIGTHTFSHYYCLAPGQDVEAFRADLAAAVRVGKAWDLPIRSLIFPRNQTNEKYLAVCAEMGIESYRGNPRSWLYEADGEEKDPFFKRVIRLADHYVNVSGHHTYSWDEMKETYPFNIPASRFLRPFSTRLRVLEPLRVRRIQASMTHAAKRGEVFHLWWHPHNFGANVQENLEVIQQILVHYQTLQERYGMRSLSMEEIAEEFLEQITSKGVSLHENPLVRS